MVNSPSAFLFLQETGEIRQGHLDEVCMRTSPLRNKQGISTTEFICVFPVFLLVLLLLVEFGFFISERHVLNHAAYVGARRGLVESTQVNASGFRRKTIMNLQEEGEECAPEVERLVKRKVASRMALVAPSLESFLPENLLGWGDQANESGELSQTVQGWLSAAHDIDSTLVQTVTTLFSGIWMAHALTSIEKCHFDESGIHLELSYLYRPKTPFAGRVMWSMYWLQSAAKKLVGSGLEFELDRDFTGVRVKTQFNSSNVEAGEGAAEVASLAEDLTAGLLQLLPPAAAALASSTGASPKLFEVADLLTQAGRSPEEWVTTGMQQLESQLTAFLMDFPEDLRFVPMKTSLSLAWLEADTFRFENAHTRCFEGARTLLVAPLSRQWGGCEETGGTTQHSLWESWSRKLATPSDHIKR